jgi:4-carboxymuconolactone decarboxylase
VNNFERGMKQVEILGGQNGKKAIESLIHDFPELGKYAVGFGFGDVYAREGLDLKTKEMLSIVSLVTQGDTADQLKFHFTAALHVKVTEQELVEVLIHCIPHIGIPKVMNAFKVLDAVLKQGNK